MGIVINGKIKLSASFKGKELQDAILQEERSQQYSARGQVYHHGNKLRRNSEKISLVKAGKNKIDLLCLKLEIESYIKNQ